MECLKTGCNAYLVEYGLYAHGDLYKSAEGTVIMRVSGLISAPGHYGSVHLDCVYVEHWFDSFCAPARISTLIIASAAPLDYEGKLL